MHQNNIDKEHSDIGRLLSLSIVSQKDTTATETSQYGYENLGTVMNFYLRFTVFKLLWQWKGKLL